MKYPGFLIDWIDEHMMEANFICFCKNSN